MMRLKTRINTLNNLLLVLIILAGCNTSKKETGTAKPEVSKPNILYILADDLGYGDLSCLGQSKFKTPNIDKLAASGMVFTQHYSGSTVCAPSRSALLTGQHTGHTPIRGNKEIDPEGQHPMPSEAYTVAELLKNAGYVTSAFGKWGLGFPGSEGDPNRQGFDEFLGYNCQRLAHHYYPYYLWHNQDKVFLEGNEGKSQLNYAPKYIHDEALKFLENNKDTVFFMFYASALPHAELLLDEKYIEPFKGKYLPEVSYKGVDDGEEYRQGPYGSQQHAHAAFAAMVSVLDQQVGELVAKLEELGIAENTLVVFSSDNGPHREGGADPDYFDSNGIFKGYKRDLYEGGIRVPMIASWKGKIKPGSTTSHVSAFWDVLPTFAELTNADIPENIDGISFLPTLLDGPHQKQHEYLYWEFHEKGGRIALRKGKWKAVKYGILENPNKTMELYDLSSDPEEQNNLAGEYPELVKELNGLISNARTDSPVFQFKSTTYLESN